jgi:hypothetical protein
MASTTKGFPKNKLFQNFQGAEKGLPSASPFLLSSLYEKSTHLLFKWK